MALLRHLPPPSTTPGTTNHQFNPNQIPIFAPLHKPSHIVFPNNHLSLSLSLSSTPKKSNICVFHVANSSIQAQESTEHEQQEQKQEEYSKTRLLAQNVPWNCNADDLRPLFERFGTVLDIELSMYNKTRNRGLAFVSMGSPEEALAAFNGLQSFEFEGRVLNLNWAKPKKEKPVNVPQQPKPTPIHNLFVANLPFQARAKDLTEFFNADKGNVVSAEVIFYDNPRKAAGYGFVSFNTKAEAEAALVAFQGKEFMGRSIRVAPSKRFLRNETKAAMELRNTATEITHVQTSGELVEAQS